MKKKIVIIISFFIFFSFNSHALIEVDITRGNLNPLPVAVRKFKHWIRNINNYRK